MIEKEKIAELKKSIDLVALVESRGIPLKKNGKSYKGLCPFHDDKKPSLSVNPSTNLWQCFGCGAGGDVIRFIELIENVSFKEAVKQLSDSGARWPRKHGAESKAQREKPLSVKERKLLNRVIEFYHTAFCEDPRAKDYMGSRGIKSPELFSAFKIGFSNGALLKTLPNDGEITKQLKEIGILNSKGREHFYGCVTFPLYDINGDPVGIYGRRIDGIGKNNSPSHLYLPGPRHGIFNRQAARAYKEIICPESIIDALTLINAGIKNAIPCYGTNGLTEDHITLFKKEETETVYICFDGDDTGKDGAKEVSAKLRSEGLKTYTIFLPDGEDINSLFSLTANAMARFKELLYEANPDRGNIKEEEKETYTAMDYGFILCISDRIYEVRGIIKSSGKLKATVKGLKQVKGKNLFHVDTVDMYSSRSRAYLAKGLCDLYGQEDQVITMDIQRLLELAESYKPSQPEDVTKHKEEMTPKDREAALAFLHNPHMFDMLISDFETLGYTGEETNKLLCYIAAISRKMEEPLSVMIQSRSAAGKSYLQDTVLSMIPDEDYVKYTRLTDQALFYKGSYSLVNKILAVEELAGMDGAIYSIRSIQSSKKISVAYTGKDPVTGELQTQDHTVEGPVMVFITTTDVDIDGETASRFMFISIDESREMTEKILRKQRGKHTMEGMINELKSGEIRKRHKAVNALLRPLHVFNPYADLLTFSSESLRARRDQNKYLNLIRAITYLFQYQRKVRTLRHNGKALEYINVTLPDIKKANDIANEVLGRSLDELSPPSRELLGLITEMSMKAIEEQGLNDKAYQFNRREIREYSGWSDFQIRTHIMQLEELEYIYSITGKRGKEYVYELVYAGGGKDGRPFLIGLIDIDELRKKAEDLGIRDDL